jgi:hypothetical protein
MERKSGSLPNAISSKPFPLAQSNTSQADIEYLLLSRLSRDSPIPPKRISNSFRFRTVPRSGQVFQPLKRMAHIKKMGMMKLHGMWEEE